MRKLVSVVVIGSVLILVAVAAQAQLPGEVIRASIPFSFEVHGRVLPAGRYEISRISDEPMGLMIRNIDHMRNEALFETEPVYENARSSKNEIVFKRYGDTYFLSEVESAGEQTAREVYPSRAERRLLNESAKNHVQPQTVTVAWN